MLLQSGMVVRDDIQNEYVIDDFIGNGGYGFVFKAHRISDGAVFAVKTIPYSTGVNTGSLMFKNEMTSSKGIQSENVVKYYFTHFGDTFPSLPPYIIMEYAPDGTLGDLIETARSNNQHFSLDSIRDLFFQLANGMKAINEVIVHRDIKPENILRIGTTLKITDFGLSKLALESTRAATFKGYGTYLYVAPEGWRSEKNTVQMDIYSMGVVFYQIATLEYPYKNIDQTSSIEDIKAAHLFSPVKKACLDANLPPNMISTILRMLEKAVDKRYKNWDEIISGLETPKTNDPALGSAVEGAVKQALSIEILKQEKAAAAHEEKLKENEFKQVVLFQFEESIFEPMNNFVEKYNDFYQGTNRLTIKKTFDKWTIQSSDRADFYLVTPFKTKITVEIEIIQTKNFTRRNYYDRPFGGNKYIEEHYNPECDKRKVLAWGYIQIDQQDGFNILLLERVNSDDPYGDWFVLENHPSVFARTDRRGQFAFKFGELERGVSELNVTSLVDSTLKPLEAQYLYDFVTNCISQDKYKV